VITENGPWRSPKTAILITENGYPDHLMGRRRVR